MTGIELASRPALTLIESLLTELRRLDDKLVLAEVHLLESRVFRGIGNMPKAKVHYRPCLTRLAVLTPPRPR
jgi:hypothetical protein